MKALLALLLVQLAAIPAGTASPFAAEAPITSTPSHLLRSSAASAKVDDINTLTPYAYKVYPERTGEGSGSGIVDIEELGADEEWETTTPAPAAVPKDAGTTPPSVSTPASPRPAPLACADVEGTAVKMQGRCHYVLDDGGDVPDIMCEEIVAVDRVLDTYTSMFYTAVTYSLAPRQESGPRCAHLTRVEIRRLEQLPPGGEVENYAEYVNEDVLALASRVLKVALLDLRPDSDGADAVLLSDFGCVFNQSDNASSCDPDLHVKLNKNPQYFNRPWRIYVEFNPGFVQVAQSFLGGLGSKALLEELEVHGGGNWGQPPYLTSLMPRMRRVDLSGTGLTYLNPDIFLKWPHLQVLNLARNSFASVPMGISALRQLRVLDMAENPLVKSAIYDTLRPLSMLHFLNLSHTPLQGFEPLVAATEDTEEDYLGTALELVDMSACYIANLDTPAAVRFFKRNSNLRVVHLSGNPLRTVPPELFRPLRALQQLHLARTNLASPLHLRLAADARLLALDLSANNLTTPNVIVTEGNVDALDLSNNLLRPWTDPQAFKSVRALNLSRAALSTFTPAMLESLKDLRWVDLGWNPIDCDSCDLPHLQSWLEEAASRGMPDLYRLGRPVSDLECVHPSAKRFVPIRQAPAPPSDHCSGGILVWCLAVTAAIVLLTIVLLIVRFRLKVIYVARVVQVKYTNGSDKANNLNQPST